MLLLLVLLDLRLVHLLRLLRRLTLSLRHHLTASLERPKPYPQSQPNETLMHDEAEDDPENHNEDEG
jgi:hypothetical protein